MKTKMPVLFVGHGSPMNAIESNDFTDYWRKLGNELPTPKAVLCISAHWLTRGTFITAMESPRTIHDFGGFPQKLFDVKYPAPGSPTLASETQRLIHQADVHLDHDWGLDHGTWSITKQMFPDANVPVLQLSIDFHQPASYHYQLAEDLKSLRNKGVLIMGSGNMIHNLRMVRFPANGDLNQSGGYDWAEEINNEMKRSLLTGDHQTLINYEKYGEAAKLAIPTPDHYYPMLYALALQDQSDEIEIFNDQCLAGSLSMTSFKLS